MSKFLLFSDREGGRILRLGGPKKKISGAGREFFAQIFDVIFLKHELAVKFGDSHLPNSCGTSYTYY